MRWSTAAAVLTGAVLVVASCGNGDAASPKQAASNATSTTAAPEPPVPLPDPVQFVDIEGGEYRFTFTPDTTQALRPGWTVVRLRNTGVEAHQVMFARLKDGVDPAALAAAGAGDSSGAGAIAFVDMLGGVSYIGPGHEITAMVNLPEGTVLAMCYVPDAKGVAHALMGMTATLTVSGDAPPAPPVASSQLPADAGVAGTIELADGGYRFPKQMSTGWYHVRNTDTDDPAKGLHELALMRLARPVRDAELPTVVADLAANRTPSVGLDAVGGLGAVSAGFDGYVYLDLETGTYLAVDFMPDPGEPRPHLIDGYYATFERGEDAP